VNLRSLSRLGVLLGCCLLACDDAPERTAGGDDMGNFLQAHLVDGTGAPVAGRVQVVSDVDTLSLSVDPSGTIHLPSRLRSWVKVSANGADYLLHAPPVRGSAGTWKLGVARPLVGWTKSRAVLSIAGLGAAIREGSFFRFAAVPPGRPLMIARNDSFYVSLGLDLELDRINASGAAPDTLVMAPLVASASGLQVASRSDTSGCGAGCPTWFYDLDNTVLRAVPIYRIDTARAVSGRGDSGLVASVLRAEARGRWILLDLLLRGASTIPVLEVSPGLMRGPGDSSVVPGPYNNLLVSARMANDSLVVGPADALVLHRVALLRDLPVEMSDSLLTYGASNVWFSPVSRAPSETCVLRADSISSLCGSSGKEWILVR
jgi:hypothetical protein